MEQMIRITDLNGAHVFPYRGRVWEDLFPHVAEWWDFCYRRRGCYAYYGGYDCLYVGQSKNIAHRLVQHFREHHGYAHTADTILIFPLPIMGPRCELNLNYAERALIRELAPQYNIAFVSR